MFLKSRPPITLVCSAALEVEARASLHGFVATERLHFGGVTPADAQRQSIEVPESHELVGIDAGLFAQVNWKEMVYGIFGSAQDYLTHHFGFGLLHEGRLVAEAHGVVGGGLVEYGISTHPEYRRRGLTKVVTRQLMKHGGQLGLWTVATCAAGKVESVRAITQSGLRQEHSYRVFTLSR
ncbi:GNAT family N-acetyltransferase [Archangium sp.]|uniref:GNAT family N-acetyltransferase n=1 Tax=Archangium sp. TaxID=1872627 RepID=UPI002D485AB6|nr:GNAT family N-acetyltransferase [Archangium sp.]HYO54544.1 GNAT family N-acetyltransferase [Archangium sp.]